MSPQDRYALPDGGSSEDGPETGRERLERALGELYPGRGPELLPRLLSLIEASRIKGTDAGVGNTAGGVGDSVDRTAAPPRFQAGDAILIAYGDMLKGAGAPLGILADFCGRRLAGRFSHLHLLPFFPSSSDEGFSVMDFGVVDPRLGDWSDIERL
ncbi:MAG: hypothetical protein JNG85_00550, partial [Spirochaetaceae bacterium]|nr:hypothetical protein [Spirochaetaceae bacterium]